MDLNNSLKNKEYARTGTLIETDQLIAVLFFGFWCSLFVYFGSNFIYWQDDNVWVKGVAQWMDIPVHEAYIQHFINRPTEQWFSVHPLNINESFSYHFLPDLISAGLQSAGFDLTWTLALPIIFASFGFLYEGYFFFRDRHNATIAALVMSSLLLFGGIGFLYRIYNPQHFLNFFYETSLFAAENKIFQSDFPNIFCDILFSQRGIPFGLWMFFFTIRRYEKLGIANATLLLISNGIMMLSMIHGSVALHFYLGIAFLLNPNKRLLKFILVLFLESVIIYLIFFKSSSQNGYFGFISGFYYGPYSMGWLRFWGASTFMLLPLSLYFLYRSKKIDHHSLFFLFIFVFINFVKLQPNMWDNIKLFIFSLPFIYERIFIGIFSIAHHNKRYAFLFLSLICLWSSGAWDVKDVVFSNRLDFQLFSKEDVYLAETVKQVLPKNTTIIIENKHNHFALQILPHHPLLGFQFNLNTYGHDYRALKDRINFILNGGDDDELIKERNISAIIITKNSLYDQREEKRVSAWSRNADSVFPSISLLTKKYKIIAENNKYIVFSTKVTESLDHNLHTDGRK
jgi:hypothetical protein